MSKIFVGRIEEVGELNSYNDKGDAVANIVVGTTREIVGGIMETVKRTVVLFRGEATKAVDNLKPNDHVVFSEVQRSPRIYTNAKGLPVELVDLRAEGFTKITKKQFEENMTALQEKAIPDSEFSFTADDRETLQKAAALVAKQRADAADADSQDNPLDDDGDDGLDS